MLFRRISAGVLALVAVTGAAEAHHSFAMFDGTRVMTVTGVVKDYQWTNPHTWIELAVPAPGGKTAQWSIEGGAISMLKRQGWSRDSFKPGDKVTIGINPLKNGDTGGSFVFAKFPDGHALGREGGGLVLGRGAGASQRN